jgi:hypothetical protein
MYLCMKVKHVHNANCMPSGVLIQVLCKLKEVCRPNGGGLNLLKDLSHNAKCKKWHSMALAEWSLQPPL